MKGPQWSGSTQEVVLSRQEDARSVVSYLLAQPIDALAAVNALRIVEPLAGQDLDTCSWGGQQTSHFAPRSVPLSLDCTDLLLAVSSSCTGLKCLVLEKSILHDTEAGSIGRFGTRLEELWLSTNSSARPLRRPLVTLMLSQLPRLTSLKLSYMRDTSADFARSLQPLVHLTRLELSYAVFGNQGAGQVIAGALAKHQTNLLDLILLECGVDDAMLDTVMCIQSLTTLRVQDEDAPEESHPTNRGLLRLPQLRNLKRLELFGEELRLDPELLASIAKLPVLERLSIAGLDGLLVPTPFAGHTQALLAYQPQPISLAPDAQGYPDRACEGAASVKDDLDMEHTSAGEIDGCPSALLSDSESGSESMDDATSRPVMSDASSQHAFHPEDKSRRLAVPGQHLSAAVPRIEPLQRSMHHTKPLQLLANLSVLVLYGPASLQSDPPPLARLLPQPLLKELKLSACASAANMRVLTACQKGLEKLSINHTPVADLYPACALAPDMMGESTLDSSTDRRADQGPTSSSQQLVSESAISILGVGLPDMTGLSMLRVLRLKDLSGFGDIHLHQLAAAAANLPHLVELKLRQMPLLTDAGIAVLPALHALQRLKLYEMGYGVTDGGVAMALSAMHGLREFKAKGCVSVTSMLPQYYAAAKAHYFGPNAPLTASVVVTQELAGVVGQGSCMTPYPHGYGYGGAYY